MVVLPGVMFCLAALYVMRMSRLLPRPVYECFSHGSGTLVVSGIVSLQYVGKEEQLHDKEYENQFDDYYGPELFAHGHGPESVDIESCYPCRYVAPSVHVAVSVFCGSVRWWAAGEEPVPQLLSSSIAFSSMVSLPLSASWVFMSTAHPSVGSTPFSVELPLASSMEQAENLTLHPHGISEE